MRLRNIVHTRWFILPDAKAVGAVRRYVMTGRVRRGMEQTESQSSVTHMKPVMHQPSIRRLPAPCMRWELGHIVSIELLQPSEQVGQLWNADCDGNLNQPRCHSRLSSRGPRMIVSGD